MDSRVEQLEELLEQGQKFNSDNFSIRGNPVYTAYGGYDSPGWLAWKTRVGNLVSEVVDQNSPPIEMLSEAWNIHTEGTPNSYFLRQRFLLLSALQQSINVAQKDVFGELKKPKGITSSAVISNRVFVVHGHDEKTKMELEIFLKSIGLEPVVLHREDDKGRTLIEKFEENTDVGFAFILLTPDEVAYTIDQEELKDASRKKEVRARPNVIFEFGYFVGKLTRDRVCCLIKGKVDRPSDIHGLMYKQIDDTIESMGFEIIKELKAAGYTLTI